MDGMSWIPNGRKRSEPVQYGGALYIPVAGDDLGDAASVRI